ncbi:hypothetical protein SAMN06265379_1146 [Saccharicrinis carchari]|uniref:Uncharacterized protein n=1 Tax=Saccharicrinis carchari TaxID=1168039 RepID=A0A521F3J0_SACCC|nr:hypothetical protein [Saccharicrinis carchari]SMO90723.1 hypothetical protein SAMN06265379_1146 [Saccharicrinis carchari]
MIQIIDKQLELLHTEFHESPENKKIRELIHVLELFREVFKVVLNGQNLDSPALALFVAQLTTGKGEVDFVRMTNEFMKLHQVKQTHIKENTGISQARVSDFLNRKHAMQSDTLAKIFTMPTL